MFKLGIKNEIVPINFRPNWLHGSLHISRTGILSFVITAIDPEVFPRIKGENVGGFSTLASYGDSFFDSDSQKRQSVDDY